MTDWQPIETAPKDERILLLAWGDEVYSGEWNEYRGGFAPDYWEGERIDNITHWMPLPAKPQSA